MAGEDVTDSVTGAIHTIIASYTGITYDSLGDRIGMSYNVMTDEYPASRGQLRILGLARNSE